jgi:hypothetical protein
MVAHGSLSTFQFTNLLWKVFELRMDHDEDSERQATQHLQCFAGHQPGEDCDRAGFGLTEFSRVWAYTPKSGDSSLAQAVGAIVLWPGLGCRAIAGLELSDCLAGGVAETEGAG